MRRLQTMFLGLCLLANLALPVARAQNDVYDLRDNAFSHNNTGLAYLHKKDYPDAIAEFRAAILLNPQSAMTAAIYNNLGLAYRGHHMQTLAMACFQHAIRLQPNYAHYYQNLVDSWTEQGSLLSAHDALSGLTDNNPQNSEAFFLLGLIHEALGRPDSAREAFQAFLALKPHADLVDAARGHLQKLRRAGL
ncbi:MAG: tetratricopeptide repeat protein [Candidatus Melainabacteria bacterium]